MGMDCINFYVHWYGGKPMTIPLSVAKDAEVEDILRYLAPRISRLLNLEKDLNMAQIGLSGDFDGVPTLHTKAAVLGKITSHLSARPLLSNAPVVSQEEEENSLHGVMLRAAQVYWSQGNYSSARSFVMHLLRADPTSVEARHLYAAILYAGRRDAECRKVLEGLLETNPNDVAALKQLSTLCVKTDDAEEAIRLSRRALHDCDLDSESVLNFQAVLASALHKKGEVNQALFTLMTIVTANERHFPSLMLLGDINASLNNFPAALSWYTAAVMHPQGIASDSVAEGFARLIGRYDDPVAEISKAFGTSIEVSAPALVFVASIVHNEGRFDTSVSILKEARRLLPKDPSAALGLAHAQEDLGNYSDALDTVQDMLESLQDAEGWKAEKDLMLANPKALSEEQQQIRASLLEQDRLALLEREKLDTHKTSEAARFDRKTVAFWNEHLELSTLLRKISLRIRVLRHKREGTSFYKYKDIDDAQRQELFKTRAKYQSANGVGFLEQITPDEAGSGGPSVLVDFTLGIPEFEQTHARDRIPLPDLSIVLGVSAENQLEEKAVLTVTKRSPNDPTNPGTSASTQARMDSRDDFEMLMRVKGGGDVVSALMAAVKMLYFGGHLRGLNDLVADVEKLKQRVSPQTLNYNDNAYFLKIQEVCVFPKIVHDPLPKIHVVGDMRICEIAWETAPIHNVSHLFVPHNVTGLQIAHLAEPPLLGIPMRRVLDDTFASLPKNAKVLLMVGDIDMRSGIPFNMKRTIYHEPAQACAILSATLVAYLRKAHKMYGFEFFIHPVLPIMSACTVTAAAFNHTLEHYVSSVSLGYIHVLSLDDIYCDSDISPYFLHSLWTLLPMYSNLVAEQIELSH